LLVPEIVRADPIVAITNIPIATTGGSTITNTDWKGLIFSTPSAVSEISSIQLGLNNIPGSYPTSPNIEIGLYSVESGHPSIQLNSLPLQSVSMTESKQMYSFIIPNWQMAANTSYALVLKSDLTSIKWGNTVTIPSGINGYTYLGFNIYSSGSWSGDGIGSTLNAVVISVTQSTISAGSTYLASNLDVTVNPVFQGGTLAMNEAVGSYSKYFTLSNSTTNTIDQLGNISTFTGVISDATTSGKIIIANSGTANHGSVTLSGNNTYSGGTQVNAGANLIINSGAALGTGTLALVGSPTIAATLTTTASTTIANAITVEGDPIFNVASGTTTTASGVIADGSSSGDVVVQGGGTLELTAANTYTGPTTIDSGSTLALSGNGSIANSSVANSGTFNIQNTANNVSVAGLTQTSTGSLLMNMSPTNNQRVNVTGTASIAGALSLNASAGTYTAGKYTLLTAHGVTGTFGTFTSNLSSFTRLGYTLSYDANDVYLNFLPNLLDTQNSLQANVAALQGVYSLQTGTVNNSLSYDCNNFGAKGFCVSTGGRYSNASESTSNTTSAMIIAGYKINDHLRIGASADQNLYNTDVAQIASVRSNTPLMGAFVVWNQNADKTGFETKVAAGYNNSDLNVNRVAVGTSEAGQGSTALNTLSESMTTSYAIKLGENYRLSPYAGVRHTSVSANGYAEQSTANVTAPLSYNGLNQESTSALLGVRLAGQVYKNTTVQTSAGFEEDMHNSVNNYSATGLAGLSAITFNPNIQRTRAVVNFGASYELAKGHHLAFNTIYRQESFQGVDTKMAYVNYSMGF
jgi:autotransporter-associated beta strand protein